MTKSRSSIENITKSRELFFKRQTNKRQLLYFFKHDSIQQTCVFELLPYLLNWILFNPVSPNPAASIRSRKTSPLSPGVSGQNGSSTDAAGASEGDLLLQVWLLRLCLAGEA